MSDDDFGTIAARPRDAGVLRRHRELLAGMAADAPSEQLAKEYRRLMARIDVELDAMLQAPVSAGMRPLVTTRVPDSAVPGESDVEPRSRLALILLSAVVALVAIATLIWYTSADRRREGPVAVRETAPAPTETTGSVVPVESALRVTPAAHDYGVLRKGTRATRQFEVVNRSEEPVTIVLARSKCRCLFYEYQALIPPKGKESVTVTIDGARAKAGEIRETIRITAKSDPAVQTTFDVNATVQ